MSAILALIEKYQQQGFRLDYRDGERYAALKRSIGDGLAPVVGGEQLKVGERIEICGGRVVLSNYYKRGSLWSGSAETACSGGNIYQYGDDDVILETY